MADHVQLLECPMCDFAVRPIDDYVLQLHFEQLHTADSPFIIDDDPEPLPPSLSSKPASKQKQVEDAPSSDEDALTVECLEPDCGELVLLSDFNDHLDYHAAETLSFDETTGQYHSHPSSATMEGALTPHHPASASNKQHYSEHGLNTYLPDAWRQNDDQRRKIKKHAPRERANTNSSVKSTLSRSILTFNPFAVFDKAVKPPSKTGRLGKSELGPYAWEDRMPKWLYEQLHVGPKITVTNRINRDGRLIKQEQVQNETPGLLPILAQLSALDRSVQEAYYCHPSTLHIGKTPKEGSFCGYRNIQMLLSYIQGAKAQGHEEFPGRTPGILKLQDLIEEAWDKGINTIGRVQTGGIRGTRKYIGTPEAQAFFLNSEISCAVEMFSDDKNRKIDAHESLLTAIEKYFSQAVVPDGSNVYKTLLPPIYLQQPGHSLTIVGFERRRDDSCNLVVFDPMYHTSPAMHKLIGRRNIRSARPEVMHAYRRGARQLRKHAAFEILILTATPPLFPAWDVLRQFPDCRFVYAFFRSRTLGYDVYPEDHFLRNFPWQQYGGLWICDEARFARAEPISTLLAQALRRITSNGSSNQSSQCNSPISPFTSSSFQKLPAANAHMGSEAYTRLPSYVPSFDGLASPLASDPQNLAGGFAFNVPRNCSPLSQPEAIRPKLSLLTDVGRKYPGFPTPLSPTLGAMTTFPSPASERCGEHGVFLDASPAVRAASPMSVDGLELSGPFRYYDSLDFEHYTSQMGHIDAIISGNSRWPSRSGQLPKRTTSGTPSTSNLSVATLPSSRSPSRFASPRTAMIKNITTKQALQDLSHNPKLYPAPSLQFHPGAVNMYKSPTRSSPPSISSKPSPRQSVPTRPSIHIANGTKTNTTSPIDPSGTMLLYTSNRNVDSGLLGVRPLSEAQVAEYRFWRPCGRRNCAFGCGGAQEGERAAAKRLFRDIEEIKVNNEESASMQEPRAPNFAFGSDGQNEDSSADEDCEVEEATLSSSTWAGRRLVTNWNQFLLSCEREGVAKF